MAPLASHLRKALSKRHAAELAHRQAAAAAAAASATRANLDAAAAQLAKMPASNPLPNQPKGPQQ